MTLLLDTHVLLWWLADSPRLTASMQAAIADPVARVAVSAASTWEMAIKSGLGKLIAPDDIVAALPAEGFESLDITLDDGIVAGRLPRHHSDPFDRMLIAQAQRRGWTVVTADRRFTAYDVAVLG